MCQAFGACMLSFIGVPDTIFPSVFAVGVGGCLAIHILILEQTLNLSRMRDSHLPICITCRDIAAMSWYSVTTGAKRGCACVDHGPGTLAGMMEARWYDDMMFLRIQDSHSCVGLAQKTGPWTRCSLFHIPLFKTTTLGTYIYDCYLHKRLAWLASSSLNLPSGYDHRRHLRQGHLS